MIGVLSGPVNLEAEIVLKIIRFADWAEFVRILWKFVRINPAGTFQICRCY